MRKEKYDVIEKREERKKNGSVTIQKMSEEDHSTRQTSNVRSSVALEANATGCVDDGRDIYPRDSPDLKSHVRRNKSRRCLRKEIERLISENNILTAKLNGSGTMEVHEATSRMYEKYSKLEGHYENLVRETKGLRILLAKHEAEHKKLQIRCKELTQRLEDLEEAKLYLSSVNQKVEAENNRLSEDVRLLQNVIYSLNIELERYQSKLRDQGSNDVLPLEKSYKSPDNKRAAMAEGLVGIEEAKIKASWGPVSVHALGPLLDAFQENLLEKQELIGEYEREMKSISDICKDIISENECARDETENLRSKCNRYAERLKDIVENIGSLQRENDCLSKQTVYQKEKLREIHTAYEQRIKSMLLENDRLYGEYTECRMELSKFEMKYNLLIEERKKMRKTNEGTIPAEVHVTTVDECKRLFEDLKYRYDADRKRLSMQIKDMEESRPELEKQLALATAEKDRLETLSKTLGKDVKRMQRKVECMRNVIYTVQISRNAMKKRLNKTILYCKQLNLEYERVMGDKERLATLLCKTEKENADIHYLSDSIANRMGKLKNQLKSMKKYTQHQLTTTEKHIKMQEYGVHQMKFEYLRELQRLKGLIREKEELIGRLQQEKYATRNDLELVWKVATTGQEKIKDILKNV